MSYPSSRYDILVIEDDDAIREVMSTMLREEGYRVAEATDGRDALHQLRAGLQPLLIILDWKMPVMDGAQFRLAQLADPQLTEIPVAVVSAHAFDDIGAVVDADAFLRKPFRFAQLLETVARFCPV